MYTAYVLTDESRDLLEQKFQPHYEKFLGHHVTVTFGVDKNATLPPEAVIKVVGKKDTGDGLEVLVVSVDGSVHRQDGSIYHITWSLDPEKYAPKDSNTLLQDTASRYIMTLPLKIETTPQLLS